MLTREKNKTDTCTEVCFKIISSCSSFVVIYTVQLSSLGGAVGSSISLVFKQQQRIQYRGKLVMQWSSSSSERLSRPGSGGLLKWKVAWNTISTKTPRIPPKIRPHMPAEAHPVTFLLHRFSLVTSLFELSLFSCQPLVISEAICLYLEMSTSHLTTPSDPSVKLLWCICVITTARQLRFYCKTEKKAPSWGPSLSPLSIRKHTIRLYGKKG